MRFTIVLISLALVVAAAPGDSLGWGSITHAHMMNVVGERHDVENLQEMYGSTISDMFNLAMDSPFCDFMYGCMHYGFDEIVPYACTELRGAAMAGIASHNDAWGADWTAHHRARSIPEPVGYVASKEGALAPALATMLTDLLASAGVPDAETVALAIAPGLAHNFVETAVDLIVSRNEDPLVGYRLVASSLLRAPGIPLMVARAFADDLAAQFGISWFRAYVFIIGIEREHRELMAMYGGIFTKGFDEAVALLSEQGALYAGMMLESLTGVAVPVPPEMVGGFLVDFAIPAVQSDYGQEIALTISYLEERLSEEGFTAVPTLSLAEGESRRFETTPAATRLEQNYPNPFNPATTIPFELAGRAHVRLAVHDAAGRLVRELVNESRGAGAYAEEWDGRDSRGADAVSGVYFYRLEAGTFVETRKMILLR